MKQIFCFLFILVTLNISAQKKQKIWVTAINGNIIKGVLVSTTDSSVNIFPAKFSEYNDHPKTSIVTHEYSNIIKIKTHKKGGLLKGILIGAGIGISPLLISSAFGRGEGGAYISVATFPIGIITGAIIGGTSKKKFVIEGDANRFNTFRKSMK